MNISISRIAPILAASTLALAAAMPASVHAQGQERVNVRGQVLSFSGKTLKVKSRDGKTLDISLAEGWKLAGLQRATVADIQPGGYVGIASLPKADGGDGALEVLIFPPAMKGTAEGSFAWDLKPNSNMTNATVANAVKDVDGHTVTVSYHGMEKKIAIPQGTPIVSFAPATNADLKPGAVVFVPAMKDGKGGLLAQQVVVGANGVVPPM